MNYIIMYIKSITMDGFKSYGQRTIVEGFDPFFNAITGLNGSGKSNILDGICFLLGISNLSQVRAANLQELVYKNGQTGITKATVSVTFDNSDSSQSPIGYEHHKEFTVTRQIVIGGQNKYLINGTIATNSRVKDLFQSVQLNVNNPHFLIMQGRITKVLNMKPQEILSMIEEASGTKMYESKKLVAQKTIETKEAKLREIKTLLAEDITPTLTRLKEERAAFLEYQKVERELEHLTKLDVAYEYVSAEEISRKSDEALGAAEESLKALEINTVRIAEESSKVHQKLTEQISKREVERKGVLSDLESELSNCEKNEVKLNRNMRNVQSGLQDEELKLKTLQQQKTDEASSISEKRGQLQATNVELEEFKKVNMKDLEAVTAAEGRFQAIIAGQSCDDGEGPKETVVQQLMDAKMEITKAETEIKQGDMKIKHWREELKKKSKELKKTESDHEQSVSSLKPLEVEIQRIEREMQKVDYQEGKAEEIDSHLRNLKNEVAELNERHDSFLNRFQQLDFQYDDPVPRFDRSKVKGFVCEAFSITDPGMATALEVVAGGKLYNVIVDNEDTGKLILEKGNLRRRHTIIPLNKIKGYSITPDVLRRAEQLVGKNNVWTALSLIKYDAVLRPAMEFAFGNCLVCRDMASAKEVALDPAIRKRTVTIDGEVFDPAGTLTGGSRRSAESFLLTLSEMNRLKSQLKEKRAELESVSKTLVEAKRLCGIFNEMKRNLEMKQKEAELIRQNIAQTVHHKLLEEVNLVQQSLVNEENNMAECQKIIDERLVKVEELETKMKNADKIRKQQLKEAENNVNHCKKSAKLSSQKLSEKTQAIHILTLEIEELENGANSNDQHLQNVESNITDLKKQLEEVTLAVSAAKEAVVEARQRVTAQSNILKQFDHEIHELQRSENELGKAAEKNKLDIKTIEISINKMKTTTEEATYRIKELVANFDWINTEKEFFGKPNTAYDFSVVDLNEARSQIAKLRDRKEELSRHVNMRAMSLLDRTEEQYTELMKKKKTIKKDKDTIAAVIKELDEKKKEALQTAWVKVNADFGSIFSTVLPGTQAKLMPPEGKTVLDGLEVKVAFGDTWKQSLNELSGGQRSLVALSLILSLLLFRPAPIYILDEVDAALDLSHTQNIGNMLKSHFKHSQFIIVSLKDGMFNNANVLFKTKFVDGMSTVSRHVQSRHAN